MSLRGWLRAPACASCGDRKFVDNEPDCGDVGDPAPAILVETTPEDHPNRVGHLVRKSIPVRLAS